MKTTVITVSLLSLLSVPAFAAGPARSGSQQHNLGTVNVNAPEPFHGQRAVDLLALETDVSPRQVSMILRHCPETNYSFLAEVKADRQFRQALGDERFSALIDGRPIPLHSEKVMQAVQAMAAQQSLQSNEGISLAVEWPGH